MQGCFSPLRPHSRVLLAGRAPATGTLGGFGPTPSRTLFTVLAEAPPSLAGHSFVGTLALAASSEEECRTCLDGRFRAGALGFTSDSRLGRAVGLTELCPSIVLLHLQLLCYLSPWPMNPQKVEMVGQRDPMGLQCRMGPPPRDQF